MALLCPRSHRSLHVGLFLLAVAPDLGRGELLLAANPDLGRGVAPLSHASALSVVDNERRLYTWTS